MQRECSLEQAMRLKKPCHSKLNFEKQYGPRRELRPLQLLELEVAATAKVIVFVECRSAGGGLLLASHSVALGTRRCSVLLYEELRC